MRLFHISFTNFEELIRWQNKISRLIEMMITKQYFNISPKQKIRKQSLKTLRKSKRMKNRLIQLCWMISQEIFSQVGVIPAVFEIYEYKKNKKKFMVIDLNRPLIDRLFIQNQLDIPIRGKNILKTP